MNIHGRLSKIENIMRPRDSSIWLARKVEDSDLYNVTAPRSAEHRRMTAREVEETLTGTIVFVIRKPRQA